MVQYVSTNVNDFEWNFLNPIVWVQMVTIWVGLLCFVLLKAQYDWRLILFYSENKMALSFLKILGSEISVFQIRTDQVIVSDMSFRNTVVNVFTEILITFSFPSPLFLNFPLFCPAQQYLS